MWEQARELGDKGSVCKFRLRAAVGIHRVCCRMQEVSMYSLGRGLLEGPQVPRREVETHKASSWSQHHHGTKGWGGPDISGMALWTGRRLVLDREQLA